MNSLGFIRIKCILGCNARTPVVPPAGLEPAHLASEASALSSELQGLGYKLIQTLAGPCEVHFTPRRGRTTAERKKG